MVRRAEPRVSQRQILKVFDCEAWTSMVYGESFSTLVDLGMCVEIFKVVFCVQRLSSGADICFKPLKWPPGPTLDM